MFPVDCPRKDVTIVSTNIFACAYFVMVILKTGFEITFILGRLHVVAQLIEPESCRILSSRNSKVGKHLEFTKTT